MNISRSPNSRNVNENSPADDHEDEQVVDQQALLDDLAGEVLPTEAPAGERAEDDAEDERDGDVERR